jgi:glycosyltransferase involved in cell wall biosynthesis
MVMKKISIVIPVYNEEYFISGTLESISHVNYPTDDFEVIVVTDGCTDGTVEVVKKFPFVRMIELKQNVGRYEARRTGAKATQYPNILFLDSRIRVDPNILAVIHQTNAKSIQGTHVEIEQPGLFETFYNAMRRKIFWRYYDNRSKILVLNSENFDSLPKGTNVFFVEKDVLFQAYEALATHDMSGDSSDDTQLIKAIVQITPVTIHPAVKITYFYRKSFRANAHHLYGFVATSFVDYYLHPAQKYFWLVIVLPMLALLGILAWLIFIPIALSTKLGVLLAVDVVISLYLALSFRDFFVILFMMPLSVLIFYIGVIRGIFVKYKKERMLKEIT